MTLEINGKGVEVMFVGKFNAYNLLAVYGAACLLGQEPEEVLRKMSLLVPVAGRFQTLHSSKGYTAIVDYAHTPRALNNVLSSIRDVLGNRGHIITVVGAIETGIKETTHDGSGSGEFERSGNIDIG